MSTVHVSTGYEPRPIQHMLHTVLFMVRFAVLVCHRRFGKTVFAINHMIDMGLKCEHKNPQYAYCAPTFAQAKRVAWEYLKQYTRAIPGVKVNEGELRVDIPRPGREDFIRYWLLGSDNPDTIRGMYLDGAILDEYGDMHPGVWGTVIRPALSDRLGWAIFIGTPKGANHFYHLAQFAKTAKNWYLGIFKASETNIILASELEEAKGAISEEEYLQEFECAFNANLTGSYYARMLLDLEKRKQITGVPYDPAACVDTFWDLGINDTTVIWFVQVIGREVHVIDYVEQSGQSLDYYAKVIKEKRYSYGHHYLPHDANARELQTGKTRAQFLYNLNVRPQRIVPKLSISSGIQAARMLLPKCWFDIHNCDRGIQALKNYQKKWDARNQIFMDQPLHNWSSNGADAFRMMAVALKSDNGNGRNIDLPRRAIMDYNEFGNH